MFTVMELIGYSVTTVIGYNDLQRCHLLVIGYNDGEGGGWGLLVV